MRLLSLLGRGLPRAHLALAAVMGCHAVGVDDRRQSFLFSKVSSRSLVDGIAATVDDSDDLTECIWMSGEVWGVEDAGAHE